MQRYFIKIGFKGTNFHGWQSQKNASSIQDELNHVLSLKLSENIQVTGAGRTDTGVHASYFMAHFDSVKEDLDTKKSVINGLNRFLPKDIAVYNIFKVIPNAHARFSAVSRTYKYYMHQVKDPFLTETSHYYPHQLDIYAMNKASKLLMTCTDFESFCKLHSDNKSFICNITECFWTSIDNKLVFTITADRFLRNMVRAIVGTLLDVGKGRLSIDELKAVISSKNRSKAGISAPARGLFLTDIRYPWDIYLKAYF